MGHGYLYNVIVNINNRKNLTIYLGMIKGKLIFDQYWNTFFKLLKKITAEYLTKFTNASSENILV